MTSPPVARHIDADKSGGLDSEEFRAGMTRCAHRGPSPVPETTTNASCDIAAERALTLALDGYLTRYHTANAINAYSMIYRSLYSSL
jgi:hypothetical protein